MASAAGREIKAHDQFATKTPDTDEWLEIAQQDIKVMDECYKNKDYGSSAYHCQQAIEKIVKFAVHKYGIVDNPADLNHDVIKGLLEHWKITKSLPIKEPWVVDALELAEKLLTVLCKSSRGIKGQDKTGKDDETPSPKDVLWAESLGVSMDSPKLTEMSDKITAPPASLVKKFYMYHLPKEAKKIVESVQRSEKKEDRRSTILAAYIEPCRTLWTEFKKTNKPHAGRKKLDKITAEKCLLLWLLANLDTILKVTPHEEYGRYPGVLRKKSRSQWYSEQSSSLLALEKLAREAFLELYKMIKR